MNPMERVLERYRRDLPLFAKTHLTISMKDVAKTSGKFNMNSAQIILHNVCETQKKEEGWVRVQILKARQMGVTTYVNSRMYNRCSLFPGIRAFMMAHQQGATNNIFNMVKDFHRKLPPELHTAPLKQNTSEIHFSNGSMYLTGTAGSKEYRSYMLHMLHGSEVAFWENPINHMAGLEEALSSAPGTEAYMESTANGTNHFKLMWDSAVAGIGEYRPVFLPWFLDETYVRQPDSTFALKTDDGDGETGRLSETEYKEHYELTLPQMAWRRWRIQKYGTRAGKTGIAKFEQEYPSCPEEAFAGEGALSFINPALVQRAANRTLNPLHYSSYPTIVGVDPSTSHGPDESAIIRRRGNIFYAPQSWETIIEMELLEMCRQILDTDCNLMVIDQTDGIGDALVTTLQADRRYVRKVIGVIFGARAERPDRFADQRAELYSRLAAFFSDDVDIPGEPAEIAIDCGATQRKGAGERVLRLEPKDDIRRRTGRSPDWSDAMALTFHSRAYATHPSSELQQRVGQSTYLRAGRRQRG